MKVTKKGSFRIKEQKLRLGRAKRELPRILINQAKNHFLKGFRKGGYQTDASGGGWRPRKDSRTTGAILVDVGDLRADIQVRKVSFSRSVLGTRNIPYAARHNEGLAGMPKREFIGESLRLEREQIKTIERALK